MHAQQEGVLEALLTQLNHRDLPHLQQIEDKLEAGYDLNSFDMRFLSDMVDNIHQYTAVFEKHSQYKHLAIQLMATLADLVAMARQNKKQV